MPRPKRGKAMLSLPRFRLQLKFFNDIINID